TLGIFTPVAIWLYKKYYLNHLYAGQLNFKLNATWTAYMSAVYVPIFIALGIIAIFSIIYFSILGTLSGFSSNSVIFGIFMMYAIIGLF
ncbi:DUF898 domain-containing protein, partial [Acinetobacter baumannii]